MGRTESWDLAVGQKYQVSTPRNKKKRFGKRKHKSCFLPVGVFFLTASCSEDRCPLLVLAPGSACLFGLRGRKLERLQGWGRCWEVNQGAGGLVACGVWDAEKPLRFGLRNYGVKTLRALLFSEK